MYLGLQFRKNVSLSFLIDLQFIPCKKCDAKPIDKSPILLRITVRENNGSLLHRYRKVFWFPFGFSTQLGHYFELIGHNPGIIEWKKNDSDAIWSTSGMFFMLRANWIRGHLVFGVQVTFIRNCLHAQFRKDFYQRFVFEIYEGQLIYKSISLVQLLDVRPSWGKGGTIKPWRSSDYMLLCFYFL